MKVIKIGAVWCSGCLVMGPRWKEIEKENPWLKTKYYEFDDSEKIVEKFGLDQGKLPTFIFLDKKGKEFLRLSGEVEKDTLVDIITKHKDK